jgi:hypothetical protein
MFHSIFAHTKNASERLMVWAKSLWNMSCLNHFWYEPKVYGTVFLHEAKVYQTGLNHFWHEPKAYGPALNHFWCESKINGNPIFKLISSYQMSNSFALNFYSNL